MEESFKTVSEELEKLRAGLLSAERRAERYRRLEEHAFEIKLEQRVRAETWKFRAQCSLALNVALAGLVLLVVWAL